jgi:hypothetical protein
VHDSGTLVKTEDDSSIVSVLSVHDSGTLVKTEDDSSIVSVLSVRDSGTLVKIDVGFNPTPEGHNPSTLVISIDNKEDIVKKAPYRLTDNTDTMEESTSVFAKVPESCTDNTDTMEGISSLLSRWMKRSAQKKLTDGDRKVPSESTILLTEHNKIYVKAPLTFPKDNITQDSRNIIPVLDKQPPNVKYQFITNVNEAREALDELAVKGEIVCPVFFTC